MGLDLSAVKGNLGPDPVLLAILSEYFGGARIRLLLSSFTLVSIS